MNTDKVLVIGLDSADPELLSTWMDRGYLPHLASVARRGVFAPLRSVPNMLSSAAWTTFQTGVNPGKHGIFEFQKRVRGRYDLVNLDGSDRRSRTVWSLLSDAGKRVAVLNVPLSYPVEPLNGVQISCWLTPSARSPGFTWPPELAGALARRYGDYPLETKHWVLARKRRFGELCGVLVDAARRKTRVAEDLLRSEPWDCFVHVIFETDKASHFFWHLTDPTHPDHRPGEADLLLRVYREADRCVGRLLDAAPPETTVLIVSDHGAGPYHRGSLHLPPLLEQLGHQISTGPGAVEQLPGASLLKPLAERAHFFLPEATRKRILRHLPGLSGRFIRDQLYGDVDWSRTRAFALKQVQTGGIIINLRGREPEGIVEPGAEYDALCAEITGQLAQLVDPQTGEPAVEDVLLARDVYRGPHLDGSVDIIVYWNSRRVLDALQLPGNPPVSGTDHGNFQEYAPNSGAHRPDGVFLAAGPAVRPGVWLRPELQDIAPTVLFALGQPVPQQMDGQPLEALFDRDFRRANPLRRCQTELARDADQPVASSDDDRKKVEQRLRELGYI